MKGGAFTDAITRKAGRFEVADEGTLFLDEVRDIPLELQPKLLRVLQEHEFERLGSTRTQQVDVRVVAATHRDLKQMVQDGEFRSDLYYRLHIFPIVRSAVARAPRRYFLFWSPFRGRICSAHESAHRNDSRPGVWKCSEAMPGQEMCRSCKTSLSER